MVKFKGEAKKELSRVVQNILELGKQENPFFFQQAILNMASAIIAEQNVRHNDQRALNEFVKYARGNEKKVQQLLSKKLRPIAAPRLPTFNLVN